MNGEFLPHKSDPTEWNRHTDQAIFFLYEGMAGQSNQNGFIFKETDGIILNDGTILRLNFDSNFEWLVVNK